jgi:hypothetical protein
MTSREHSPIAGTYPWARKDISIGFTGTYSDDGAKLVPKPGESCPEGLGHWVQSNNYLVRYRSMSLQASSASVKDLKGEPPTLMAHLFW